MAGFNLTPTTTGFTPLVQNRPNARKTAAQPIEGFVPQAIVAQLPKAPPLKRAELKAAKTHHPLKLGLKIAAWTTLAMTGIVGVAGTALADPGLLGPLGRPLNSAVVQLLPESTQSIYHWLEDQSPRAEAPSTYGELYITNPNGPAGNDQVLALSGKTTPNGSDIPAAAVSHGNVVVGFEGIEASSSNYSKAFTKLFDSDEGAVNLNQDFLMIHEGDRNRNIDDITRILKDDLQTKIIQDGGSVSLAAAGRNDPAVVTGYNVIKQALDQGDHVLVLAHSGGGAESAEALNELAAHGYRQEIAQDVKVLDMAGAASAQDVVEAGVKPNNALYIGMQEDLVAQLGHDYFNPHHPILGIENIVKAFSKASDFTLGIYHSPTQTIVPDNRAHVENFFNQGIGGTYLAS